jgi:hypothetical protein
MPVRWHCHKPANRETGVRLRGGQHTSWLLWEVLGGRRQNQGNHEGCNTSNHVAVDLCVDHAAPAAFLVTANQPFAHRGGP